MVTINPLVSIVLGITLFADRLRSGPLWVALEIVALAVLVVGVVILARSPLVAGTQGRRRPRGDAGRRQAPGRRPWARGRTDTGLDVARPARRPSTECPWPAGRSYRPVGGTRRPTEPPAAQPANDSRPALDQGQDPRRARPDRACRPRASRPGIPRMTSPSSARIDRNSAAVTRASPRALWWSSHDRPKWVQQSTSRALPCRPRWAWATARVSTEGTGPGTRSSPPARRHSARRKREVEAVDVVADHHPARQPVGQVGMDGGEGGGPGQHLRRDAVDVGGARVAAGVDQGAEGSRSRDPTDRARTTPTSTMRSSSGEKPVVSTSITANPGLCSPGTPTATTVDGGCDEGGGTLRSTRPRTGVHYRRGRKDRHDLHPMGVHLRPPPRGPQQPADQRDRRRRARRRRRPPPRCSTALCECLRSLRDAGPGPARSWSCSATSSNWPSPRPRMRPPPSPSSSPASGPGCPTPPSHRRSASSPGTTTTTSGRGPATTATCGCWPGTPRRSRPPRDRHATHLLPANDKEPVRDRFVEILAKRGEPATAVTVVQSYPNLGLVTEAGDRSVILSHGHFIEPLYRMMSLLDTVFGSPRTGRRRGLAARGRQRRVDRLLLVVDGRQRGHHAGHPLPLRVAAEHRDHPCRDRRHRTGHQGGRRVPGPGRCRGPRRGRTPPGRHRHGRPRAPPRGDRAQPPRRRRPGQLPERTGGSPRWRPRSEHPRDVTFVFGHTHKPFVDVRTPDAVLLAGRPWSTPAAGWSTRRSSTR